MTGQSPFQPFLDAQGVVLLDGGLGTALEAHGADLNDPLWSARVLLDAPETLRRVHREYLEAGADVIASCNYQATVAGLTARGLSTAQAEDLILRAADIAVEERDAWWEVGDRIGRLKPLVAASIGPYGAYLADGAEYTGGYDVSPAELRTFHERRWHILARSRVDLMACETMPSMAEIEVILELHRATPDRWIWISLSCRNETTLADGHPLSDVVQLIGEHERIAAIGANCLPPEMAVVTVDTIRANTSLPVAVYPNSGESYDPASKTWVERAPSVQHAVACLDWRRAGATVLGGCCRTGPGTIRAMCSALMEGKLVDDR